MMSATQLGTYTKFTPKQKFTTLALLHVSSATLAKWPCCMASYRTCGAYVARDDVNILVQNLVIESGHARLASYTDTGFERLIFFS